MNAIKEKLSAAVTAGDLLESSAANIIELLAGSEDPVVHGSVEELLENGNWNELNDRFFQQLAFGTGGLRSRSIGKTVTTVERGKPTEMDRPEFPCVGTNAMNFYNLSRATLGLVRYLKKWLAQQGTGGKPAIVFAHDTRHFARDFVSFCARVATENGCDVYLFEEARSTPELSFAVRHLGAQGGVVLTASHNPPHDNGYKVYFEDGAQIVEPHAGAIIAEVNSISGESYDPLPADERGTITTIGKEIDRAYMDRLRSLVLQPGLVAAAADLVVVYTNLHGTGGRITPAMLRELGFTCLTVPEQDSEDGRFPTVQSPNPENGPALKMAVELAEKEGADIVIGTDPDCDRMGVAVRDAEGKMTLLSGNMIGSLIGYYRIKTLFELGVLTDDNKANAVLIKTFVTTDLQKVIADHFGIRCVETLTGFKYIGQKLAKYENALTEQHRDGYRSLSPEESRALLLEHSSFFVFGGEESYGYLGSDIVRDKDGNGASVMFAELAAYAKSRGLALTELLDEIFAEFGYFQESLHSVVFEGAEGAAKIQKLANSYSSDPPEEVDGSALARLRDFAREEFRDVEGDLIPAEKMLFVDLEDGRRFAVRPSGTEPKIKYYLYARNCPAPGTTFDPAQLAAAKEAADASLKTLWEWLERDIQSRLA
ncbi:MAG: phospho-sugar mutase [Verrucomicrobiales bacterium]